ncbi:MAG: glycosyltransferase [Bacteroidetes bacterium]|nr:glycosyltransferase [Bacteroidota bacterium]
MIVSLVVASLILCLVLAICVDWSAGNRSIIDLGTIQADSGNVLVSIIVPACNEERSIEKTVQSLLGLHYQNKEILIVNDRSTDSTGELIDRLQRYHPQLKTLTIDNLPDGWLGKNHALFYAAEKAKGTWLLFTDADVMFEPTVLNRAMHYVKQHRVDHLAAFPSIHAAGFMLELFVAYFTIFFSMFFRPWKASDPGSRRHVGIGAFNLISKEAYLRIGTHQAIAMCPDDDMKLGKRVKESGMNQDLVAAHDLISVEWYSSVWEMVKGLEKNAFAGLDYKWYRTAAGVIGQLVCFAWPFLAVWVTEEPVRTLYSGVLLILAMTYLLQQKHHRAPWYHLMSWPVAALFMVFVMMNGLIQVTLHGGIQWRGTYYRREDLMKRG